MFIMQGSAKSISSGNSEDYVTKIDMVLPIVFGNIPNGLFSLEYDGDKVDIKIVTIVRKEDDPIFSYAKNLDIGGISFESGLGNIPFEAFTDNRGEYPSVLVTLVFPRRIATWIDDTQETGIRNDSDDERIQISGSPQNEEKIKALIVINRFIKSLNIEDKKIISYDDVTAFLETYFKKPFDRPLVLKANIFTTKNAYKNAVYDYVLPSHKESEIDQSLLKFQQNCAKKAINTENDLKLIIEEVIESVLKYHIESRRWIEPFWDGQRNINHKGEEIVIPRTPKNETKIQPTLHVVLDMALIPLGIQVIRESDEGAGSLDFRFLFTTNNGVPLSVGSEFKVAHHKEIRKGINRQLPAYLKAIRSTSGIFVVMWFKDATFFKEPKNYKKEQMESWIDYEAKSVSSDSKLNISTALLDASIRPSASNL